MTGPRGTPLRLANRLRLWLHCTWRRGNHLAVAEGNYRWRADPGWQRGWIPAVVAQRSEQLYCADCGYPNTDLMARVRVARRASA